MTTLFYKALSQAERFPIINQASYWLPVNKDTILKDKTNGVQSEEENPTPYISTSPRYSIPPPPPYEKVVKDVKEESINKKFLSSIWKRASFSSYGEYHEDVKLAELNNKVDKTQVDHAITLINLATEMKNSTNMMDSNNQNQMAVDLYLMGLEKLITALPVESDPCIKVTLERKLIELKDRYQLNLLSIQDLLNESQIEKEGNQNEEPRPIRNQISDLVIQAAVVSAVALKKSPIPNATSKVLNFALSNIQKIDEKHQIRKRTWGLASSSISKAIEIDRHYEIHQMVTGAVCTGLTAFIKAGIAYADTPSGKF